MKFSIRQTKNVKLVKKLHDKIFHGVDFPEHIIPTMWIIKDEHGEPAGFCMTATLIDEGCLFLSRAGVIKKYRGQGLHNRMIKVRERFAKRDELKTILTYTIKENYSSFSHLIKLGYQLYSPEWEYVGNDVFYFKKDTHE